MDLTEVLDTEDRYDYDAPNEVVDLAEFYNAPTDDHWFEKRASGSLLCPQLGTEEATEAPVEPAEVAEDVGSSSLPNVVTSWGGDTKPTMNNNQLRRVSKRKKETTSGPPVKKQTKLTTEELELERMRNLQKEVALHRKKNEASYKAALVGIPPPKKMAFTATVPKEFSFTTTSASSNNNNNKKEVNFTYQLRKHTSPAKALKGATIPKPFNLSTSRKRKAEDAPKYVPMAQQIQEFYKKTPERFHKPSRQVQERGPSPVKGAHHKPTVKEPTIPEGFQLQIEKRLQERRGKKPPVEVEEEEEPPHTFKSHPVSKKILEGVVGVPEKKVSTVTVPESPAFALKNRVRVQPAPVEVKPPSPIRAPPVPHFGVPFQPKLPESHQVELCPFSFDKREQEKRVLRERKLEQMRNKEAPKFKAQLLPDFSTVALPEKKKQEPTKPEPFNLLIDARGAEKTSRWEQMVQEEKKQQEEATHFKARPNVVTHKEPFKPKKEDTATGSCSGSAGFQLSTERRAQERQEYERLVSEKEAVRSLMEEQQRKEEAERKKEEITRLRQEQVHKAQPVKHYRCVKVKKSEIPLTVPHSPNFSDRFCM